MPGTARPPRSSPRFHHRRGSDGLTEAQHREIQRLRGDGEELAAYLRENRLLYALNHFFHGFSSSAQVRKFITAMAQLFDVFEVRNGSQQRQHNSFVARLLEQGSNGSGFGARPVGQVAGSDAHTLRRIGRTYTASSATSPEEFLEDIRAGRTVVFGAHSNHLSLAADIYGVVLRHYPAVLAWGNGEFPPFLRLKTAFLTLLAAPFLFTPYVIAVRHSRLERERINRFSRLVLDGELSPPSP